MDVDPAVGKILGMLMAYAVSSLGLLLAYYNYRVRVVKADRVFGPVARRVLWTVAVALVALTITGAAMIDAPPGARWQTLQQRWPGILLPALVFLASFWVTWGLYRRFSGRHADAARPPQAS